jgi:hypothetical protein
MLDARPDQFIVRAFEFVRRLSHCAGTQLGVCGFESLKEPGPAIERADRAMYGSRHLARNSAKETESRIEPASAFSLESLPS